MDLANDALQRLSTMTVAGSDWSAGIEARARALVSVGEEADHWYAESIACLARTPLRPELARSQLLYGEWLRRENRRVDARQQLRSGPREPSPRSALTALRSGHAVSWSPPASRSASGARTPSLELTPKRSTSPDWPGTDARIPRSAPNCSSARGRSSGTSARCSRSSGSPRAGTSRTHCRLRTGKWQRGTPPCSPDDSHRGRRPPGHITRRTECAHLIWPDLGRR